MSKYIKPGVYVREVDMSESTEEYSHNPNTLKDEHKKLKWANMEVVHNGYKVNVQTKAGNKKELIFKEIKEALKWIEDNMGLTGEEEEFCRGLDGRSEPAHETTTWSYIEKGIPFPPDAGLPTAESYRKSYQTTSIP